MVLRNSTPTSWLGPVPSPIVRSGVTSGQCIRLGVGAGGLGSGILAQESRPTERALNQNMQLNMTIERLALEEHAEVNEKHRLLIAVKASAARAQAACLHPDRCELSDLSDQPAIRLVVGIANARRATDISGRGEEAFSAVAPSVNGAASGCRRCYRMGPDTLHSAGAETPANVVGPRETPCSMIRCRGRGVGRDGSGCVLGCRQVSPWSATILVREK